MFGLYQSPGNNLSEGCESESESESESEVAQLCRNLCDPMDCSLPGFSVHGIFQARVLEWLAISFSKGGARVYRSFWWEKRKHLMEEENVTAKHKTNIPG